ncbi:MAG: hypothetical protein RLZZ602_17 [Pseudomonadota bacterium]
MTGTSTRICYIHAGTHKTASTYIQDKLSQHKRALFLEGISYNFRGLSEKRHKPIAMATKGGDVNTLAEHLKRHKDQERDVLISAEQFATAFSNEGIYASAKATASELGFEMKTIIFIRPQLDYMNSRYIQECKRFYHAQSFRSYVQSYTQQHRDDIFNYYSYFHHLLTDKSCTFLPFSKSYGDPFEQLMRAIKVPSVSTLISHPANANNAQPGAKGVWLARQVTRRMKAQGVDSRKLTPTTQISPKIARARSWDNDRFYGFSRKLERDTRRHYRQCNQDFALAAWESPWENVFPFKQQVLNTFKPSSEEEEKEMSERANEVLRYLASKNKHMAKQIISCLNQVDSQ